MTEPAIRLDGLVKRYGARQVLGGVDLTVAPGEIVALLGPNGAGKTTTVEIIEGYRKADGGTVRVLETDPSTGGPALRARVGLMLQDGGLDPRTTPRDVLGLYAAFHDGGRDPAALISLVGLDDVASTRVRRLSGGERQRLALALALVGDPEVLVLDEPTAGMDAEGKRETRALVAGLRDDGRAILLTTHDLADVERLANRVAILHGGTIVAEGSVAELTAASSPDLRVRLATEPTEASLRALATTVRGTHPDGTVSAALDSSWLRVWTHQRGVPDPNLIALVATWAAEYDLTIVELQTVGASLEERYLELTGDHDARTAA